MDIDHRRRGIVSGSIWMTVVPLALFFMPVLNGLVAGLVGGYRIGDARRAVVAAVLPAGVVALGLWLLFRGEDAPAWIAVSIVALFAGAATGGMSRHVARPSAAV